MSTKWQNWARTVSVTPREVKRPTSADEVAAAVREALDRGTTVRMVGSGHSFTPVALADDIMLSPSGLGNRFEVNGDGTVTVSAGMDLTTLCERLASAGLALSNMGDIRVQTIAGALQTGTHGTGRGTATFADMVTELELVTGDGIVRNVSAGTEPDLFQSARVGLGAFGIVTAVTLEVSPAFGLAAHEYPATLSETLATFDGLAADNDHVEFYWLPHTEKCAIKVNNRIEPDVTGPSRLATWWDKSFIQNTAFGTVCKVGRAAPGYVPLLNRLSARMLSERTYEDASWRVFTTPRRVRFCEMEYALPRQSLLPALQEAKALIEKKHWRISFPVEVRCAPGDSAWLSPTTGRDTGYLAFHAFDRTDHSWFIEIERILNAHGGRPHWGKMHTRRHDDLRTAYPEWEKVARVRNVADPSRIFANDYIRRVLGE